MGCQTADQNSYVRFSDCQYYFSIIHDYSQKHWFNCILMSTTQKNKQNPEKVSLSESRIVNFIYFIKAISTVSTVLIL